MEDVKRERLDAAGWRVGSAQDFLELTPEEASYVELKVQLARLLREQRKSLGQTQAGLAAELGSSQSRIAKAEANDESVSVDLLVRALFATGISVGELGELLQQQVGE
jgi:hypothetical protein